MIDLGAGPSMKAHWGAYDETIRQWMEKAREFLLVKRLWNKDASLWKRNSAEQKEIINRLGWLTVAGAMDSQISEIISFADEIRSEGYATVVLIGMGGSSLVSETFQSIFGNKEGYPKLLVIDSTDPERIRDIAAAVQIRKTLFIVSSKSGATIELISLFKYFFDEVRVNRGDKAGSQFIAITDPGTPLEELARLREFRKVFAGPPDVGGRFSALTPFGLVPAALIGVDIRKILESAGRLMEKSGETAPLFENASLALGVGMAVLAEEGRDKLTLVTSKGLESFGDWAEQLVAESTGKDDLGIVPVVREAIGETQLYGSDRFFVGILLDTLDNTPIETCLDAFRAQGHPVFTIRLKELSELGGEFFRFEAATAIACALLKVNAFDQPDVQAAKDKAKFLLKKIEQGDKVAIRSQGTSLEFFWENVNENDYIGILAFLPDRRALRQKLTDLRITLRDLTKKAVTLGIGPRYLHSTGQLHKGGANNGNFLVITAEHANDLQIPGEGFSFGQLELAQAAGDLETLEMKGRNIFHFHLENLSEKALADCIAKIKNSAKAVFQKSTL